MISACDTITQANSDADMDAVSSDKHYDGDDFDRAQTRLQAPQAEVIQHLVGNNPTAARMSLGRSPCAQQLD
jgi:hypothetical protein